MNAPLNLLKRKVLLTPGPATTEDSVKLAMVKPDICPRVTSFQNLMADIRQRLTRVVADPETHETVLLAGSGTAAVEAMLLAASRDEGEIVIINNGAYGRRMVEIANAYGISHRIYESSLVEPVDAGRLAAFLQQGPGGYLAVVHHETTTGMLNKLAELKDAAELYEYRFIVDAMSAYAAVPLSMERDGVAMVAASANKNLQGMPGVAFVIAERCLLQRLAQLPGRGFYLDICAEFLSVARTGQCRFTPPVQLLYALDQALSEFEVEGIVNRYSRYRRLWQSLYEGVQRLGLQPLLPHEWQSGMLLAVREPDLPGYDFEAMHDWFDAQGVGIYPGKISGLPYFRLCSIGALHDVDIEHFLLLLKQYLNSLLKKDFQS